MCSSYLQATSYELWRVFTKYSFTKYLQWKAIKWNTFAETWTSINNYGQSTGDLVFLECVGFLHSRSCWWRGRTSGREVACIYSGISRLQRLNLFNNKHSMGACGEKLAVLHNNSTASDLRLVWLKWRLPAVLQSCKVMETTILRSCICGYLMRHHGHRDSTTNTHQSSIV